jgi:hypothetical protein
MLRRIWPFLLLFSNALAMPIVDPNDNDEVILVSYMNYFITKEMVDGCSKTTPDQIKAYSDAFSIWELRNKQQIDLVNKAFGIHFSSRAKERDEIRGATPSLARDSSSSVTYDRDFCTQFLRALNAGGVMDYAVKLKEHMNILNRRFGGAE